MKSKLLIGYKIRYDSDKKPKSKLVEIEEDGAKLIFASQSYQAKRIKFTIKRHIPPYKELTSALKYTGPEKFHTFGQYCLGLFKAARKNEFAKKS